MSRKPAESFWRRNGLSLAFLAMMLVSVVGHALAGWKVENEERARAGEPSQTVAEYIAGGAFQSTLFENWESEFLQMALFVLLTVPLRQKGSSESRKMDPSEEKHKRYPTEQQPWPVRKGGPWRVLYEHSLSAALFALFALSFVGHW